MNPSTITLKYFLSTMENELREPIEELKILPLCERKLFRKYRRLVWKITNKQNISKLPNFCNRGFHNYHLDHKVSIWYGFKNKLDHKMIANINNLEFIPYKNNMSKGTKSNFKDFKGAQIVLFRDDL